MMTDDELTALEELAAKATEGPWAEVEEIGDGEYPCGVRTLAGFICTIEYDFPEAVNEANRAFICAARQAVPRLIADLRAARQRIQELEAAQAELDAEEAEMWRCMVARCPADSRPTDSWGLCADHAEEWKRHRAYGNSDAFARWVNGLDASNSPPAAPEPPRTPETEATGQEDGTRGQDGGTVVETRSDLCGCYHERQDHMLDGTCRGAQCRCQRFRLLRGGA